MAKYMIAYFGGPKFEAPEQGKTYMAKWRAWMGGLGDALVDPGAPFSPGKRISIGEIVDQGPDFLSGFSILTADGIDHAVRLAQGCPHLEHGAIEIAEMMDMKMT